MVNVATKERMEVREEHGVNVMNVQFDDVAFEVIAMDSRDGCNVLAQSSSLGPF